MIGTSFGTQVLQVSGFQCPCSTGDEDLPMREPLHERRAKYDSMRARQAVAAGRSADEDGGGGKRQREQDAVYEVSEDTGVCLDGPREAAGALGVSHE